MNKLTEKSENRVQKFSWSDVFKRYEGAISNALGGDPKKIDSFITACTQKIILGSIELQVAARANPNSAVLAAIDAASLGLSPTIMNEFHFVPFGVDFRTKQATPKASVVMQLGYKGLMKLAHAAVREHGVSYKVLYAQPVYSNDFFRLELGSEPHLNHTPVAFGDRGELIGVYAAAVLSDGGKYFFTMSVEEVLNHQKRFTRSSFLKDPENFEAYALKTVMRILINRQLLMSSTLSTALAKEDSTNAVMNEIENITSETFTPPVVDATTEEKQVAPQLPPGVDDDSFWENLNDDLTPSNVEKEVVDSKA